MQFDIATIFADVSIQALVQLKPLKRRPCPADDSLSSLDPDATYTLNHDRLATQALNHQTSLLYLVPIAKYKPSRSEFC